MTELHENHPGIVRMKALARSYIWWPNIDNDIEMTVKSCNSCQMNQAMPSKAPIHPWEKTTAPWMRNQYKLEQPEPAKNENESNLVEPPTQEPSFVDNENQ